VQSQLDGYNLTGMDIIQSIDRDRQRSPPIGTIRSISNHIALGRLVPSIWPRCSVYNVLGSATLWYWAMQVFDSHMLLTCRPIPSTTVHDSPYFVHHNDNHMTVLVFFAVGYGPCGCIAPWNLTVDLGKAKKFTPQSNKGLKIPVTIHGRCSAVECSAKITKKLQTALSSMELDRELAMLYEMLPPRLWNCRSSAEIIHTLKAPNHCWWARFPVLERCTVPWSVRLIDHIHPSIASHITATVLAGITPDMLCKITKRTIAAWSVKHNPHRKIGWISKVLLSSVLPVSSSTI
jgi:hypothetical protein